MDPLLKFFIDRVQRTYFSNFPLYKSADNRYTGVFMKHQLNTRFMLIEQDCAIAQLNCIGPNDKPINIEDLQRLCRVSQSAIVLDRFVRSIHLLNLMAEPERWRIVYLPVTQALITGVETGHGQVFGEILKQLGLRSTQFCILLPDTLRQDPLRFEQVTQAYQYHGFATTEWHALKLADQTQI